MADVLRGTNDVGRLLGRSAQAKRLIDSLQMQLAGLAKTPPAAAHPTVLALASADPIYVYGQNTLFTDAIRRAARTRFAVRFHSPCRP